MRLLILGMIATLSFTVLFSEEEVETSAPPAMCDSEMNLGPDSRIQIGGTYSYVQISPAGNIRTHGNLGGVQAIYEYRAPNRIYGGLEFTWRQGHTKGTSVRRSLLDFNVQERIGYTASWGNDAGRLSLFSGFGYRYLGERVTTAASAPVIFNYNEFYIPVGFLLDGKLSSIVSLGLNFQWMPQVFPSVAINPLGGANWVILRHLNNYLLEMPLTFTFTQKYHLGLIIVPFFETWHDGSTVAKTASGTALKVPTNSYLFGGVNVNFLFSF